MWRSWFGAPGRLSFETGDLHGVVSPDGTSPRLYSLASGASDGLVCVRRVPGGVCSSHLTGLQPGATIQALVQMHELFRPAAGDPDRRGTGIGPLIGLVRHNAPQRVTYLYFGARDAEDGFLYRRRQRLPSARRVAPSGLARRAARRGP